MSRNVDHPVYEIKVDPVLRSHEIDVQHEQFTHLVEVHLLDNLERISGKCWIGGYCTSLPHIDANGDPHRLSCSNHVEAPRFGANYRCITDSLGFSDVIEPPDTYVYEGFCACAYASDNE